MMLKSIKWLMDPESPLYIKPEANPLLAQWLTRFMLSMNESLMHRSIEVLVELSKYTLEGFEKLEAKNPNQMDFRK
jgi:D-amino-acid dehydrogenase